MSQDNLFDIVIDALDKNIDTIERLLGYVNFNCRGVQHTMDTLQNYLFTEGFVVKDGKVSL